MSIQRGLRWARLPRMSLPPPKMFIGLLVLAYALPGLFGHDPWKPEDAIGVGVVQQMLDAGHWWVPFLAGEPWSDDGPLYFWLASALAKAASFALGLDDGARLASAFCLVVTVLALHAATRELFGPGPAAGALLALLGCLGLMVHSHEVLPELGLLAGHALAWYGLALLPRRALRGGMLLGLGAAAAMLSKGLLAPLAPLAVGVLLPALSPHWRDRGHWRGMAIAVTAFAVPVLLWTIAVQQFAASAGQAWLAGQLALPSPLDADRLAGFAKLLSWSAWPAWPIALWLVWERRRAMHSPGITLGLAATAAALAVLLVHPQAREVHTLAIMLPLALLAGAGIERLRRGAANALAWFGGMAFALLAGLIWFGWIAMMTGVPGRMARNFSRLEPGFEPVFQPVALTAALLLTLGWIYVLLRSERSPYRSVLWWAAGTTLLWGLVMTLWLPWVDYGRSYRNVAVTLKRGIPPGAACVESRHLGESQRAALAFHAGLITRRVEVHGADRCPVLLVQGRPDRDDRVGGDWRRVLEVSRPRDRERYRLYVRDSRR